VVHVEFACDGHGARLYPDETIPCLSRKLIAPSLKPLRQKNVGAAIAFLTGQAYKPLSIVNRGRTMIALLVALRDVVIAVLIGWLGVSAEPAEKQQSQADPAYSGETQVSMLG
jgi:hypothetical protein